MKGGKDEVHDGRPQVHPSERTTRGSQDGELARGEKLRNEHEPDELEVVGSVGLGLYDVVDGLVEDRDGA